MTTHYTHKRQTSITPTVFEPTIPGSEQPQTYALDSAATRISIKKKKARKILIRRKR